MKSSKSMSSRVRTVCLIFPPQVKPAYFCRPCSKVSICTPRFSYFPSITTSKPLVVPVNFSLPLSFFGSPGLVSLLGRGLNPWLLVVVVVVVMLMLSRSC